ncbi:MAG: hypothetical protein P8020_21735 [Acidobacteriota bacterium]
MRKSGRFLVGVSVSFLLIAFSGPTWLPAQNLGDYYTAGFSNARTGVNAHMGDFRTWATTTPLDSRTPGRG